MIDTNPSLPMRAATQLRAKLPQKKSEGPVETHQEKTQNLTNSKPSPLPLGFGPSGETFLPSGSRSTPLKRRAGMDFSVKLRFYEDLPESGPLTEITIP